jgi:uncharacterized protein YbjT (DUF2867 family)
LDSKPVLVTGAIGNVGREVVRALRERGLRVQVGLRPDSVSNPAWSGDHCVYRVAFDFEAADGQTAAFANCDSLFLMRLPQLDDAFEALVARAE